MTTLLLLALMWGNNLCSVASVPTCSMVANASFFLAAQVGSATLVPGTTSTYTDGTNTWAGNPFCGVTGFLLQPTSPAIDAGTVIPEIHCSHSGPCLDEGKQEWYGVAPDVGACEFVASVTPPPPQWTFCANENEFCSFSGTKRVRYGAQGVFAFGTFTNGVACTNEVFGDPIFGFFKTCEYETAPTGSLPSAPSNLRVQ